MSGLGQSNSNHYEIEDEETDWAEIKDEDVITSVHGPDYPKSEYVDGLFRIENPKYDPDYGKNYQYNYIDRLQIQVDSYRPPIPTSEIPFSHRKRSFSQKFQDSFLKYWKFLPIAFGVLVIILTGIVVLAVLERKEHHIVEASSTQSPITCKEDFTPIANKCWKFYNERVFLGNATDICYKSGTYLVTIKNAEENRALGNFIGDSTDAWIGLHCGSSAVMKCQWDDGTELKGYSNVVQEANTSCTHYDKATGNWYVDYCMLKARPFVCETSGL